MLGKQHLGLLNGGGVYRVTHRNQETHLRRGRQYADLGCVAIEELQALQASSVEVVINIFGEVGAHGGFFETETWSPFAGDLVEAGGFESVVAGLLKHLRQVWHCNVASRRGRPGAVVPTQCFFLQSLLANRPEGEDERLAGVANPLLGEVERVIARAVDLEGGISNQ